MRINKNEPAQQKGPIVAAPKSWLFVPANRPDRIEAAVASAADAVIIDLEDACPETQKVAARATIEQLAKRLPEGRCHVRINALSTEHALADLLAVVQSNIAGVLIPKMESVGELAAADWTISQLENQRRLPPLSVALTPMIETARGVSELSAIAGSGLPRIRRLTFGAGDLTTDLDLHWSADESELAAFRFALRVASRAAGLEPPIDTVWPAINDIEGLIESSTRSKALGFGSKLAIHPNQIVAINSAFTPTEAEVAYAHRVIAALAEAEAQGAGALRFEGRLIDHVSLVQARRILAVAGVAK